MASDYRIIADGTTIYLHNSSGRPTSGGAATAVATTPWIVRSPDWTPQASAVETLLAGGPPFRNSSIAVNQAYGVVSETIPLILDGSTHDTTVARLQQLRQLSNQAIFGLPAVLYVQPHGATSPVYFEILAAVAQERAADGSESPGEGATIIHVDLMITRSALGGRLSSGETLINAQTYTVAGSTVTLPTNSVSLGSPAGDLIYEGSPLNIKITPTTASSNIGELWAASVYAAASATSNNALNVPGGAAVTALWTPTSALTHAGSKLRVIARVTNVGATPNSKYFAVVRGSAGTSSPALWSSPAVGVSPTTESTGLVDFGPIPVDFLRTISPLTGSITVEFYATKNAGTCTLISVEFLIYNDFCKITNVLATQAGGQYLWLQSFRAKSSQVCLESPPSASTLTSADALYAPATVRGRLPRAYSGASLWLNWVDSTGNNTTTATRAASVTATHAPQYKTLRGNG